MFDELVQVTLDHLYAMEHSTRGRTLLMLAANAKTEMVRFEAIEELLWTGPVARGDEPNPVRPDARYAQLRRLGRSA